MRIARIGIASVLAAFTLNVWAGPGAAPSTAGGKPKFDVTGTWNAKTEGRGAAVNYVFVFKQDKDDVTGTVSVNGMAATPISDVKLYKTKMLFSVKMTMPAMPAMPGAPAPAQPAAPREIETKYTATIDGDEMTIEFQGGMGMMMGMGGGMGGGGGPPPGGGDMGGGMGGGMGGMGGGMGGMKTTVKATRVK